jgi:hypothetical protein
LIRHKILGTELPHICQVPRSPDLKSEIGRASCKDWVYRMENGRTHTISVTLQSLHKLRGSLQQQQPGRHNFNNLRKHKKNSPWRQKKSGTVGRNTYTWATDIEDVCEIICTTSCQQQCIMHTGILKRTARKGMVIRRWSRGLSDAYWPNLAGNTAIKRSRDAYEASGLRGLKSPFADNPSILLCQRLLTACWSEALEQNVKLCE